MRRRQSQRKQQAAGSRQQAAGRDCKSAAVHYVALDSKLSNHSLGVEALRLSPSSPLRSDLRHTLAPTHQLKSLATVLNQETALQLGIRGLRSFVCACRPIG